MHKQLVKKVISAGSRTALALVLMVLAYAACWAVWYRRPALPDQVVDLRKNHSQSGYRITFCAGLADNPLGFPGHAYVVWRNSPDDRPIQAESVGYITQHYSDQFISPLVSVPGQLCCAPAQFEPSNLERLTVLVDSQTYQATLEARKKWNTAKFKAAQHDCLSFTTYIARTAGLVIPEYRCLYPQDQLCQLKQLNPQNVSCRPAGPYAFPRPVDCDHDP